MVPNGSDESWKAVAECYQHDRRVIWSPVKTAHANVARNHGKTLAQGKYIRFLDDDDYFLPLAPCEQLMELEKLGLDLSQGNVVQVDQQYTALQVFRSNIDGEFSVSMLLPSRVTLSHSFLFNRNKIKSCEWRPDLNYAQDVAFALDIAGKLDLSSMKFDQQVAAWVQHDGQRISTATTQEKHVIMWALFLLEAIKSLESRGALNKKRKLAATIGIWECIHIGFPQAPIYWSKFYAQCPTFIKEGKPQHKFHSSIIGRSINPILWEWAMMPHRNIKRKMRK